MIGRIVTAAGIVLAFLLVLAIIWGAAGIRPAIAQEMQLAPCETIEDIEKVVAAEGGKVIAVIKVPGQLINQLVIADFLGQIMVGGMVLGCSYGLPQEFGPSIPPTGPVLAPSQSTPA